MPVSCPMAAGLVVLCERLALNADIEAVAEPGAGGIEVVMGFVELGMSNTTRGPDAPSDEERARHNVPHVPSNTWCEACV